MLSHYPKIKSLLQPKELKEALPEVISPKDKSKSISPEKETPSEIISPEKEHPLEITSNEKGVPPEITSRAYDSLSIGHKRSRERDSTTPKVWAINGGDGDMRKKKHKKCKF